MTWRSRGGWSPGPARRRRRSPSWSRAGRGVLAVAADASRRSALASGATGLARFNGGHALVACHRCGAEGVAGLAARGKGGLAAHRLRGARVVPPSSPRPSSMLSSSTRPGAAPTPTSFPVPAAPPSASRRLGAPSRPRLSTFRPASSTRSSPPPRSRSGSMSSSARRRRGRSSPPPFAPSAPAKSSAATRCGRRCRARAPHPLAPEAAARCLRVLLELGLVAGEREIGRGRRRRRILRSDPTGALSGVPRLQR